MLLVKYCCIFILFCISKTTADEKCVQTKSLTILKGCEVLNGLEIISESGYVVNDDKCAELLPKGNFAEKPVIRYTKADENKLYTIVMLDPDAPKHNPGEFFLHMIITNIPFDSYPALGGSERVNVLGFRGELLQPYIARQWLLHISYGTTLKIGDTSQGNVVTAYRKPSPPKGTGEHRYIFLLYEQAEEEFNPESPEVRFKFDYDAWLTGKQLCSPLAGQLFKAKH